jgi:glycosyltransferase involved in cell wall biosynthesis
VAQSAPVSVLIPCYCCPETVSRAVASAANQTLPPAEIILIEDASPDGGRTLAALDRLANEYAGCVQLKVLALASNVGPGAARNRGWEASTQPYLAFLDADDAWHPRKLELQIGWMEAHPEADLTGTRTQVVAEPSDLPVPPVGLHARELSLRDMLLVNLLPTRTVVVRASVQNRFALGKRYSEDYLLWLSMIAEGHRAFLLEATLACAFKPDFGVDGLSSHLWRMHLEVLDSYRQLRRGGKIGGVALTLLALMSWAKFVRRLILTACMRFYPRSRA